MKSEQRLIHIINAYRSVIAERYDYRVIASRYSIPPTVTKDTFIELKEFFLSHVYPDIDKRQKLNNAFQDLDKHIGQPRYLLNILTDSFGLIFKYGRQLPKILRTGLKAMQSFKQASLFEEELAQLSFELDKEPPYSKSDISLFISNLSTDRIEKFIAVSTSLFETLHDREQVESIVEIVSFLIQKMKSKPHIYSNAEIEGLEVGRIIIENGNRLFDKLDLNTREHLFDLIVQIERDALKTIFE